MPAQEAFLCPNKDGWTSLLPSMPAMTSSWRQLQWLLAPEEPCSRSVGRLLQVWLLVSVVLLWEVVLWADGSRSAEARQEQRHRLSDAASWHDSPLNSR